MLFGKPVSPWIIRGQALSGSCPMCAHSTRQPDQRHENRRKPRRLTPHPRSFYGATVSWASAGGLPRRGEEAEPLFGRPCGPVSRMQKPRASAGRSRAAFGRECWRILQSLHARFKRVRYAAQGYVVAGSAPRDAPWTGTGLVGTCACAGCLHSVHRCERPRVRKDQGLRQRAGFLEHLRHGAHCDLARLDVGLIEQDAQIAPATAVAISKRRIPAQARAAKPTAMRTIGWPSSERMHNLVLYGLRM